jgi:hypothetical protein
MYALRFCTSTELQQMTQSNDGPDVDIDSSIVVALRCLLLLPLILFLDPVPLELSMELPDSMSLILLVCLLVGECSIDSGIGLL